MSGLYAKELTVNKPQGGGIHVGVDMVNAYMTRVVPTRVSR